MNNFKNKRILLFAPELEKSEYRGIAFYTKSLVKSLSSLGAEIWLVSSFNPYKLKIKDFNESSRNYICNYEILQKFYNGSSVSFLNRNKFFTNNRVLNFLTSYLNKSKFVIYFLTALHVFLINNKYDKKNTQQIKFNYKNDNPYLKFEKLSFMQNVAGFLCAPNIAMNFNYRSFFPLKNKIIFNLDYYDFFITSEPLNLVSKKDIPIFQTIHDIIPLEFNPNILNTKSFYRKIKYSSVNKNIFISEVTKNKFNHLISNKIKQNKTYISESVITQPPSLQFENEENLIIYTNILNSIYSEKNSSQLKKYKKSKKSKIKKNIQPFNYFLFNASIDRRKNVHLLIESFINSEAQKNGIYLVITGQLKDDEYSKKIRKMIAINPGIISTGYINEAKKSALYINALSLLSPSLIEGFGLPVLDACCLGLNCIASDCASHREIKNLYDFKNFLNLYPPTSLTKWSDIFYNEKFYKNNNPENTQKSRFERYKKYKKILEDNFRSNLENILKFK